MTFTGIFHTWEFNVHGVMHTTLLHNAFEDASFGGALAVCGPLQINAIFPNETTQQASALMCTSTENRLFIMVVQRTTPFSLLCKLSHRIGERAGAHREKKWAGQFLRWCVRHSLFIFDIRCFISALFMYDSQGKKIGFLQFKENENFVHEKRFK